MAGDSWRSGAHAALAVTLHQPADSRPASPPAAATEAGRPDLAPRLKAESRYFCSPPPTKSPREAAQARRSESRACSYIRIIAGPSEDGGLSRTGPILARVGLSTAPSPAKACTTRHHRGPLQSAGALAEDIGQAQSPQVQASAYIPWHCDSTSAKVNNKKAPQHKSIHVLRCHSVGPSFTTQRTRWFNIALKKALKSSHCPHRPGACPLTIARETETARAQTNPAGESRQPSLVIAPAQNCAPEARADPRACAHPQLHAPAPRAPTAMA